MTLCSALIAILADGAEPFRSINQYFNRTGTGPWLPLLFWLVILAAGTGLLIAGLRRARMQRRHGAMGHPWRLFYRLLWGLPLTWGQRWRLADLARRVSPDRPAAILLTPSALAESIRRWGRGRSQSARDKMSARLAPVFQTLFNSPAE